MNYNIVILVLTIRNWYPWKKLGYFHVKTLLTFVYRKGCVIGALKPSAKCLLSQCKNLYPELNTFYCKLIY